MAAEPARLEGQRSSPIQWPSRPVVGGTDATARIGPPHSKGESCVCDEVVAAPAWVSDDRVAVYHGGSNAEKA